MSKNIYEYYYHYGLEYMYSTVTLVVSTHPLIASGLSAAAAARNR